MRDQQVWFCCKQPEGRRKLYKEKIRYFNS